jgi:hypothetical protein
MNLDREDEKLEVYLRQFQVRAPRPLPKAEKPFLFRRPAMAVGALTAAILLSIAIFVLRGRQAPPQQALVPITAQKEQVPQQISMIRLSRIAQEDPEKLGSYLDELSAPLLPDVRGSKGVLKQLARE